MVLLDGRKIKELVFNDMKDKVSKLDRKPTLAVISTMNDRASSVYIASKKRMCEYIGYDFREFNFDNISEDELISLIERLNRYEDIDGILLQLPLQAGIDCERVINYIDYRKDVDGITDINMGRVVNNNNYLSSCTALGIIRLLESYSISIKGKNVVIVGRSRLVGKSLASMFLNMDATVTLCHSKTKNLEFYTKNADILVVAVGKSKFIKKEMVKDKSVVIDVGIHKLSDGSIVGDVDFDDVADKVEYITPVPGGVGQMTVAILSENIYKAYINRH
jgi:methylenetetrahydrofolate dehydrogenase (NADP+)/methenyltetrahydrofolate cyclohydrolase